jgi:SMC interacting uncharacterized protein involved in chromosome segregation
MGAGKTPTEDPRLAAGVEFLREGARKLITFLQAYEYPKNIPVKLVKDPPTTAEFEDMAVFIVRQLDPAYKITTKLSADLPELLKLLRCVSVAVLDTIRACLRYQLSV